MDGHGDTNASAKPLRDMVRGYPGIRENLAFWDDEFNDGLPSWTNSDESVQAKYIPRGMIIDRAEGVRTFVWLLAGATEGNESDDFGMLHGLMFRPNDFSPRPAFKALQNTNTLFSDTQLDSSIHVETDPSSPPVRVYPFRSSNGKAIVAYWLPILSKPGDQFHARKTTLRIINSGIQNPVLIDVRSGRITKLSWKAGTTDTLDAVPLTDSVQAIADGSYFDWAELPEAPSELNVSKASGGVQLTWKVHGGHPDFISIERRVVHKGAWQSVSKVAGSAESYSEAGELTASEPVFYRVRAGNGAGASAYSNIATLKH
jgi:hypothetical protein